MSFASATGVPLSPQPDFIPWQPSTWPDTPMEFDDDFFKVILEIFRETIIQEIENVIKDSSKCNGSIEHRGHVIAIAQLCAIDALSSYAFFEESSAKCANCGRTDSKVNKYKQFIEQFFPENYKEFSREIYKLYRNSMIHSWNLFEVSILPDGSEIFKQENGSLCFGLINFQNALNLSLNNFLEKLKTDKKLQENTIGRYDELKKSAKE